MEYTVNNMLLRTLPDVPKKTRPSNKTATKTVKNSVKGVRSNISGEQGFRNYLKYTDPLLRMSDETTDESKLTDDMDKILSMINPEKQLEQKAQQYLQKEPVNNAEVFNEIQAMNLFKSSTPTKPSKKSSIEIYKSPAQRKKEELKKETDIIQARTEQRIKDDFENKVKERVASAKTLQATLRRKLQAKELKTKKNSDAFDARTLNKGRPKNVKGDKYNETPF